MGFRPVHWPLAPDPRDMVEQADSLAFHDLDRAERSTFCEGSQASDAAVSSAGPLTSRDEPAPCVNAVAPARQSLSQQLDDKEAARGAGGTRAA